MAPGCQTPFVQRLVNHSIQFSTHILWHRFVSSIHMERLANAGFRRPFESFDVNTAWAWIICLVLSKPRHGWLDISCCSLSTILSIRPTSSILRIPESQHSPPADVEKINGDLYKVAVWATRRKPRVRRGKGRPRSQAHGMMYR